MTMRLAVLGDSIAFGVGASRPSHTLARRISAALDDRGMAVESKVFALSGARSADLGRQVAHALEWGPHVALVVIGANDLTHFVPHDKAAEQLRVAVRALRDREIEVVVAPAPDLSMLPHVPPVMRPVVQAGSLDLRTAQVRAVLDEGGRVADASETTAAAFGGDRSLFSADRFHPSSAGYAVIAEALLPTVLEAASAARPV
jgi:lysophospholipase L1-like esterase